MMLIFSRGKGFTLLELLVVMVILSVGAAVVGPNLIRQYESMRDQQEILILENQLRFFGQQAFYRKQPITLTFDGKLMTNDLRSEPLDSFEFKFVFIKPTTVEFNRDGNPKKSELLVTLNEKEYEIKVPYIYKANWDDTD